MTCFRISLIPLFKTKHKLNTPLSPQKSPPSKYSNEKYLQTILLVKLRESQGTLEYNQMGSTKHIFLILNHSNKTKAVMNKQQTGTSLGVQWLGLCNSDAGGAGSIPGWGTKIPQAAYSQKKKNQPTNQHLKLGNLRKEMNEGKDDM